MAIQETLIYSNTEPAEVEGLTASRDLFAGPQLFMSETAQRLGHTGGQGRVEGDVQALSKGGVPFLAPADGCHE